METTSRKSKAEVKGALEDKVNKLRSKYDIALIKYKESVDLYGAENDKSKDEQSIKYAYIVFKSMEGQQKVL